MDEGGCLCGSIRYATTGEPARIVYCHCRFCQRSTGSAYLVELMFERSRFQLSRGVTAKYEQTSAGSGKQIVVNFCAKCGTKLFLELARVPNDLGVFAGTYDNPDWWERKTENAKVIFYDSAQVGALIPPGVPVFHEHVTARDGTPQQSWTYTAPHVIGRK